MRIMMRLRNAIRNKVSGCAADNSWHCKVIIVRQCFGVRGKIKLLGCKKSQEPLLHGAPATEALQLCGSQIRRTLVTLRCTGQPISGASAHSLCSRKD